MYVFGSVDWKALEREIQWLAAAMPSLGIVPAQV